MAVAPRLAAFEILDLRLVRAAALAALFEEERQHWETELHWDYRPSVELLRRHIDAHTLPGYVALRAGQVAGYCFFVYEEHKGLLGDLYVLEAWRGEGVAALLLEHALDTLEESPVVRRIEAQLLPFGLEPLEPLFTGRGYRVFPRLFMYCPLERGGLPAERTPARALRPWRERDFEPLAELIVAAYAGHVDSQINDHYGSREGALRFLQNIVVFPGCGVFQPEWSLVAPQAGGGLVGAILASEVAPGVSHITQICVRREWQRRGLGRRLLAASLERAAARGCTGVSLTVTAANHPAVALYQRFGFRVLKQFSAFTRTLRQKDRSRR